MVIEAELIPRGDGRYVRGVPNETGAETLDEWLEDAAGGLAVTPAPELDSLIEDREGGRAFRVVDAAAAPGRDICYLIAWVK